MKATTLAAAILIISFSLLARAFALEKVKVGTSVKHSFRYYLPIFAANEGGFSKQNLVELEYVPFRGGAVLSSAMAAGHLNIGMTMAPSVVLAASAGLPAFIVAPFFPRDDFYFWTRTDSRFKEVKDIRGATVGVHMLRTTSHAYGLMVAKAEGLEKEVRFVGAGGLPETMAALKARAIDVVGPNPLPPLAKLVLAGEVRPFVNVSDYLPKEWLDHVVYARKDFASTHPDSVRRVVRSILQGNRFLVENPGWAIKKMLEVEGLGEKEANLIIEREGKKFATIGTMDRKAVENVRALLIDYGIVPKDKAPPVDELFTNKFVQ